MSMDARIPADIIDATRRQVRENTYRNSTEEAAEIRRVDDELYKRVNASHALSQQRAEGFIRENAGRVGLSLDLVDELRDISERLERGGDTTALAKEYRAVKNRIDRELGVLGGLIENAKRLDTALEDPVAHAQRLYALMPASNWIAP